MLLKKYIRKINTSKSMKRFIMIINDLEKGEEITVKRIERHIEKITYEIGTQGINNYKECIEKILLYTIAQIQKGGLQ